MAYVYTHTRHDKNEVFYVGIGINHDTHERAYNLNRNSIWKRIVEKTSYHVEILHDKISREDAIEIEKALIREYGRIDLGTGILANLTDGGEGSIGRLKDELEIEKISGKNNGSWGKSWIKKPGEKDIFIHRDLIDTYLENGWVRGRTVSEEVRLKISQAKTGKSLSDEHKRKLGEKSRGHVKSDQERERRSQSLKGRKPWNKGIPGFKKLTADQKLELKLARFYLKNFES